MERVPLKVRLAAAVLPVLAIVGCTSDNASNKVVPVLTSGATAQDLGTVSPSTVRPNEGRATAAASSTPTITSPRTVTESPTVSPIRTPVSSSVDQALRLGGFNDYVRYSGENLQIDGPFTIEARIKLDNSLLPGGDAVAVKGDDTEAFGLYAKLARCIGLDGLRMAAVIDGRSVCSQFVLPKGQYVDIAMSFDNSVVRFYYNGVVAEVPFPTSVPKETGSFRMGISLKGFQNESFHGQIAALSLWQGVRNTDQMKFDLEGLRTGGLDPAQAKRIGLKFLAPFDHDFNDVVQSIKGEPHGDASLVSAN